MLLLPTQTHRVPADLAELTGGRAVLESWLDGHALDWSPRIDDMRLVFVELLTNAIEASGSTSVVTFSFSDMGTEIVLRFENRNDAGSPVELRSMPDVFETEGRGLALAQTFADRLDIHALGERVDISAHFFKRPLRAR